MQPHPHEARPALLALLLLFSLSLLHARLLFNQPSFGQDLQVLVENETAPANATLIAPDGQTHLVAFEGPQLSYRLEQTGSWDVEVKGQHRTILVRSPSPPSAVAARPSEYGDLLPIALAAATLLGLGLCALAVYLLFMRPAKPIPVILEKRREGPLVRIRLAAGTRPLSDLTLEDDVGKGFKEGPKRMTRARLDAGGVMELSYEWTGPLGEVRVRFNMDDLSCEMRCNEGAVLLREDENREIGLPKDLSLASLPSSRRGPKIPLSRRKLVRKKE